MMPAPLLSCPCCCMLCQQGFEDLPYFTFQVGPAHMQLLASEHEKAASTSKVEARPRSGLDN